MVTGQQAGGLYGDDESRFGRSAARMSRVFVTAIDGSNEQLILERPGVWQPADWSPDGRNLLLAWSEPYALGTSHSALLELDMANAEWSISRYQERNGAQRRQKGNPKE